MSRFGWAECIECGASFRRGDDEGWKVRCVACWLESKGRRPAPVATLHATLGSELAERVRPLLQLCHPDKHGGSPVANDATVWLLDVRRRLT